MKKTLFSLLSATALLWSTSCSDEAIVSVADGEALVEFSVELNDGGVASRAISKAENVSELYYEVYAYEAGKLVPTKTEIDAKNSDFAVVEGKKVFTINFNLVKGQKYDVVFWAQSERAYITSEADSLTTIAVTPATANDDTRDAFTAVYRIENVAGAQSHKVTLKRPFAQVNFGVTETDYNFAKAAGLDLANEQSSITISRVATMYNALTTEASGETAAEFTFTANELPQLEGEGAEALEVGDESYKYLATAYMLVPGSNKESQAGVVDLSMTLTTNLNSAITLDVPNAPVKRNYRTNVLGNLLTNQTDFTVVVDAKFDGDEIKEVWDGKSVEVPEYNEGTKTYTVETPENLAWLAAAVNGTLPAEGRAVIQAENFAGKTFVLADNVNLANQAWTPIGTSSNPFKGTFDGNGKTIYNLNVVMDGLSNAGLFGVTENGEIKNFTVENAKVTGRLNVGVVAGQPYTSKYTDITVQGHVEVNGMAYVGGVGGKNAYADWTNISVNADETSYVKAHSIENGTAYRTYVGGVVGFNGEGGHTFKNIASNINVVGSTCDVGGLFGIAHYSNNFENCVCTGNVEITNASEAEDAQEMGGIAGVWHNATGYVVTMTNCSFEGTLTANINDVSFYYGGLVGKPYGDGEGKLVLNGLEFTKNGVDFASVNEALASGSGYVLPFDLTGKATASNAYGVTGLTQLNGGVLDGDLHTLKVTGAGTTWASAINTTGGTIKNITVAQGFRGIFVNHNSQHAEKVVLENVTIDGPTYTISCDQGVNQGLEATGCTINGWTSYAATIGYVKFTNCSFGKGAGYKFARPYAPTQFINCEFCEGFEIDARAKVVFENCTLNGVALTNDNLASLVIGNAENASFATVVNTVDALKEAVNVAGAIVEVKAGEYTFPSSIAEGVTIKCEEGTVFVGNTKLNINGATVEGATFSNPSGTAVDQTINGTFKNCTFTGSNALRYCYAGETCVFEDCVFDGSTYGVHFDGGTNKEITFRNCKISGFNAFAAALKMVTFEDCTFVGNGKSGYNGANLWGSAKLVRCEFTFNGSTANEWIDCIGSEKTYEFKNCTINGVAYTSENHLDYKEKIFSRNKTKVTVNDVECQF